ncbi:patatin-like phospholipase family protein [bacterium]|nr:patatin-like phospholipase family protein [bacterium]
MKKINNVRLMHRLKVTFFSLLILWTWMYSGLTAFPDSTYRPKIGLVLSGGGAKGFAHIGVLKMLDSLEIPIDYISGTSMGGILGALYAIGYTGEELESLVSEIDWENLFSDQPARKLLPYIEKQQTGRYLIEIGILGTMPTIPTGMIYGQKISLLFSDITYPYGRIRNFDELPVPFRCVAADLITGNEVVLRSGSLSKAIRATMSIPTIFSPVEWGDSLLVDGGMVNNLPVDVVKDMGAEIILAVDVIGHRVPREHLNNALNVLERSTHLMGIDRWRQNIQKADLVIYPDVIQYMTSDFSHYKIHKIIEAGDRAARELKSDLIDFKELYRLERVSNPSQLPMLKKQPILSDVQIIGPASTPFDSIYHFLGLETHRPFFYQNLDCKINELMREKKFQEIYYETIPVSDVSVRLLIHVEESEMPVIYRVTVEGNENISFSLIYGFLGIQPGDPLNIKKLNRNILSLYGLDYFEYVEYEIIPVEESFVHLKVLVKELPMRELRLGLRYDDYRKLVGVIGLQINSMIIPGLRFENEFQFAGLYRFWNKLYYPSRTLNLPVYPYMRQSFKDIPTNIHDGYGRREAQYKDRSYLWAAGCGIQLDNNVNLDIEAQSEQVRIKSSIGFPESKLLSASRAHFNCFHVCGHIDTYNDALMPTSGINAVADIEISRKSWKSDTSYQRFYLALDAYLPITQKHLFRLYGFYGYGSKHLPMYKYFNKGHPDSFAGMDYDQLTGRDFILYRGEYQYFFTKDILVYLCANQAHALQKGLWLSDYPLWGTGVGIKIRSRLGLISLGYGLGSRGMQVPRDSQSKFYLDLGMRF